jgi:hypothetical protein
MATPGGSRPAQLCKIAPVGITVGKGTMHASDDQLGDKVLHLSGTRLASCLRAVAGKSRGETVALDPPSYCRTQGSRAQLIQVLTYLDELLDCLADEIVVETSRIQRCWDRFYGQPKASSAAQLTDSLRVAIDDVTTLDCAIDIEAGNFLTNYRSCTDELEWIFGFRAYAPYSHAVPYLQRSLKHFQTQMVALKPDECDDPEVFELTRDSICSGPTLTGFLTGKQAFHTWVGETRARNGAIRLGLNEADSPAVRQAPDKDRNVAKQLLGRFAAYL